MRALWALMGVVLLAGTAAAGATNLVADGSVGYRQADLSWDMDASMTVDGTVLEIWTSNETLLNASSSEVHSTFLVGSTEGLAQPEPGAWYDDCSRTVDGVEAPVHRLDDGTAVLPVGTTSVACTLTGLAAGSDVHLAVWTVEPDGTTNLSASVLATTSVADVLAAPLDTSPYLFAIGSIALSLIALLSVLAWRDRVDGRTSARGAHLYVAPALLALTVLTFYPVIYGMWLSLTDADQTRLGDQVFIGLANFAEVFATSGFLRVTAFTLLWTVANVVAHIGFGLLLALLLNAADLRGRTVYRTVLLLPWAIPSYISVLVWRGLFEPMGAINDLLGTDLNLLSDAGGARLAVILVNVWLGIPFMMMSISGALQGLPKDMYEAAKVDGIGAYDRFRHLTLPNLRSALVPLSLLGFIWTFNMFNVIYLMTDGGPNLDFDGPGSTDILITYVYDVAFRDGAYGVAAAWSVVIFLMLVAFSWTYMKRTNATEAVA